MGFGNFIRGVVAQINPFDNGATYSTYNDPNKRDQFGNPLPANKPAPTQAPSQNPGQNPANNAQNGTQIKPQSPENLFQGLNNNLRLPGAPQTNIPVTQNPANNFSPIKPLNPGTVVQPSNSNAQIDAGLNAGKSWQQIASENNLNVNNVKAYSQATRPNYGITPAAPTVTQNGQSGTLVNNHFVPAAPVIQHPGFWGQVGNGLKTAGETAVGTVSNIPEVALAAGRAATGIVQGVTQLPHIVTAGVATGTQALNNVLPNSFTSGLNRGAQDANTGVKNVTNVVNAPINAVNRGLDTAAQGYQTAVPTAYAGAQVYKNTQIPINVLAALLTAGGSTAAEGAGAAGDVANTGRLARFSNFVNKPLTDNTDNVVAKTAQAISNKTTPVVQTLNTPFSSAKTGITSLLNNRAVPTLEKAGVDTGEIGNVLSEPQLQDLTQPPTQIPVTQPQQIPVSGTPGEPVSVPVTNKTPQGNIIKENSGDAPNVTKVPTATDVANQRATTAFNNQPKSAPDQTVSGINKPSNVITKADKQDYQGVLDSKLATNQITPDEHVALSSELSKIPAQDDIVPKGKPITVKQVNSVPVEDRSVVPTQLPEKPGTVRVTAETAPKQAKSAVVAAKQTAPITDVSELSKVAKNSLENDTTGIKPNGVERSGGRVENGTAKPVEYRHLDDGSVSIVDGRHTLEYARKNGINDFPTKDVTDQYAPKAPTTKTPAELPKETQNVLDNPQKFSKSQVAAARNQRKLATQLAKTKEATAAAVDRINTVSPEHASGEGFTPTSEYGKSTNGGAYEKTSRASEMQQAKTETANMSPGDAIKTARDNQTDHGAFNRRDIRNIQAMFEDKRIPKGTPEFNEAKAILKEDGTHSAQSLALRGGNTIRRTATSDQLTSQYQSKIYRMVDDPSKVDSTAFDKVEASNNRFTDARDAANLAHTKFTEDPTPATTKAFHAAQDAADAADKNSKMVEYTVAKSILKGNKDAKQARELEKMAQSADAYQMDGIDASMLSGTGTFSRNIVNSAIGGAEEGVFGGVASRIANKLTGANSGGGIGRGSLSGFGKGVRNVVDAAKGRAADAGKNPLEHLKNYATTGNQLGDTIIDSQVAHNVLDHYTQDLKDLGYKGTELRNRASVMARRDPDNIGEVYAGAARASAGLGSGITKSTKVETVMKNAISDALSGGNPGKVSEVAAKLITRMTVGFPSAVGRSLSEGAKRASLGSLNALKLFTKSSREDPAVRAQIIKESIKQAGSGATTGMIFYGLGKSGVITGAYPSDPATRAQWQREGITENSIKIDGNYYQLPAYLGVAAVPALFSASLGRNNGNVDKAAAEVAKAIPSLLPTSQASNVLDWINGKTNSGKFLTQTAASTVRALTPAGAALAQIAKSFDPTSNDTTSGTALSNFVDKVMSGIPGENKFMSIPDKKDPAGNVIKNPGAVPLLFGASTTEQGKGVQETNAINDQVNSSVKAISDTGALKDATLRGILDDKTKAIYDEANSGKQVTPADLKKLQTALVKGVDGTTDNAYLEKGQYDTNLTALKLKRADMAADPTAKPSDIAKVDLSIKRGQVYKDNQIPYDVISSYETTSNPDWIKMGIPPGDKNYDPTLYNPDQYQQLWSMDQLMAKAGGSYDPKDPTGQKFSVPKPGGRGGNGSTAYNSDFGKLKAGTGAPTVKAYQTITQSAGGVPVIALQRPNIVHQFSGSH